ncbi:MAG: hypothetical protein HOF27_01615, partial [Rhodospirillaceae bacterium]|nr:hypothetical protein [Rhodospirillaceae bacterium]
SLSSKSNSFSKAAISLPGKSRSDTTPKLSGDMALGHALRDLAHMRHFKQVLIADIFSQGTTGH